MLLQMNMAEAQADSHPGWETRELMLLVEDGVELVYHTLRDSSTSAVLAAFDADQGLWIAERDGREYSDIVIANPTRAPAQFGQPKGETEVDPGYWEAAIRLGRIMLCNVGMEDETRARLNEFGRDRLEELVEALTNSSVWDAAADVARSLPTDEEKED